MKPASLRPLATAALASVALLAIACSPPTPPSPPPLDPTGTFDIALEIEGQVIEGVITVEGSAEDGYEGEITVMGNSATLGDFVVEDSNLAFVARTDEFTVVFEVAFEGNGFSGVLDSEMGSGTVIGTKRSN